MSYKRSRLEVYLDVLHAINDGLDKPTRIMYGTNLSWKTLQEILVSMVDQELISVNSKKRSKRYSILPKGIRALQYFLKVQEQFTIR